MKLLNELFKKKFETLKEEMSRLEEKLSDPKILSNRTQFQEVSKAHSKLLPIVSAIKKHEGLINDYMDVESMISESTDIETRDEWMSELKKLKKQISESEENLERLFTPPDPDADRNIIIEIRAGAGGDEAGLFANDLFTMYNRLSEKYGWKVELISASRTGVGGLKEIICSISGDNVYPMLKYESGVHRVQRVPKTEASGRIHTSTVTVAVLPEVEEVDIDIDLNDVRVDVCRASGPGGQGVNTTDSAVRLTYLPTGMIVYIAEERSQLKNKAKAFRVLRSRLYEQKRQEAENARSSQRKSQVGSGERSEKIRTYNFPQSRVTDHRIGYTIKRLAEFMDGDMEDMLEELEKYFREQQMNNN